MKKAILLTTLLLFSIFLVWAQENKNKRPLLIGVETPSFVAQSTDGEINFPGDFGMSWKILIAQPKAYTPVCSSELIELAYQQDSFDDLNAKLIVIVTDDLKHGMFWKMTLEEINYRDRGTVEINFPLVEDLNYKISNLYGLICPEVKLGHSVRGVFIIDPYNKLKSVFHYPIEVGMNVDEVRRTLIALQKTYNNRNVVAPANWQPGEDLMVPVISSLDRDNMGNSDSDLYQLSWCMTFRKEKYGSALINSPPLLP
jgi:peroxiredoxin 2/4